MLVAGPASLLEGENATIAFAAGEPSLLVTLAVRVTVAVPLEPMATSVGAALRVMFAGLEPEEVEPPGGVPPPEMDMMINGPLFLVRSIVRLPVLPKGSVAVKVTRLP